jgi:hypothetical protein
MTILGCAWAFCAHLYVIKHFSFNLRFASIHFTLKLCNFRTAMGMVALYAVRPILLNPLHFSKLSITDVIS